MGKNVRTILSVEHVNSNEGVILIIFTRWRSHILSKSRDVAPAVFRCLTMQLFYHTIEIILIKMY